MMTLPTVCRLEISMTEYVALVRQDAILQGHDFDDDGEEAISIYFLRRTAGSTPRIFRDNNCWRVIMMKTEEADWILARRDRAGKKRRKSGSTAIA